MVVPYNPHDSSEFYRNYYTQQNGNGLSVFKGATIQCGRGIGGFFSRVMRGAMPLLKSGAKTIGRQLIDSGANLAKDLISGEDFKRAATRNFSTGGRKLLSTLTGNSNSDRPISRKRKLKSTSSKRIASGNKRPRRGNDKNIFR